MAERFQLGFITEVEGLLGWLEEREYVVKEMGTKQFVGGRHWHISKAGERGGLELTWAPGEGEMWLDVRGNRGGEWVSGLVRELMIQFADCLPHPL